MSGLSRTKTDVILAFFGYNESFGDLNQFKQDLAQLHHAHAGAEVQRHERTPARALLTDRPREPEGPVAARRHGEQRPARAADHGGHGQGRPGPSGHVRRSVPPDAAISTPRRTQPLHDQRHPPDGRGKSHAGRDHRPGPLSRGADDQAEMHEALEKLRQAVLDKNFYWFNRYRTVDGYSIYGGRADLHVRGRSDQPRGDAARDGSPRRDDRQSRPANLGRGAGRRPEGRRQQHAAIHPGQDEQARHAAPTVRTSSWTARRRSSR